MMRTRCSLRRLTMAVGAAVGVAVSSSAATSRDVTADLPLILLRVGERVERYFARAQSLVCLETVHIQPLGTGLTPEGFGRTVESELQLSWPAPSERTRVEGDAPGSASSFEARMRRQILKVNGHPPRRNDPNNCTVPEQYETETPALSMLLPDKQLEYVFALARPEQVERRTAIVLDYKETARVSLDVQQVEGNEDCVSFDLKGGVRGRIWIDARTYDVLRLDQGLIGLVEIRLPRPLLRRSGTTSSWTMERWDTSIRFKPVTFENPSETLTLPVSISSLRITRGSGMPRQRMTTEFSNYKRFLTGGRVVKE